MNRNDMARTLAPALPAGIAYPSKPVGKGFGARWDARKIAEFQAERLAECGYRLVYVECAGGENHAPNIDGKCAVCGRDVDVIDPHYVPCPHLTPEEAADCTRCSPSSLPRRSEEGGDEHG